MFGVAGVGACLLQVIHADKCVLPGNSHHENREWPAKVLGLASYGQDKLIESAQLSATAESNAVQWCTYFLLEIQGFGGTKRPICLWLAPKRRSQKLFSAGARARKKVIF